MAPLVRKLQTWGFRPHRPQQAPLFPRYKEPKLQTGLLQPTELLILCRVTVLSKQMQLQMPCFVGLQEKSLGLCAFKSHVSEPCSYVSEPCSHVFKLCTLKLHVSKPRFHVAFKPYSFKPYPVGSLNFFNSDPVLLDPRLRNICLVLATLIVRRVLKRASWRTYKDNGSGMGLRL